MTVRLQASQEGVGEGVRHVGVPLDDRGCGRGAKQAHEVGHLQLAQIGGEDLRALASELLYLASELLYLASELLYLASESRLLVTATLWAVTNKHARAGHNAHRVEHEPELMRREQARPRVAE